MHVLAFSDSQLLEAIQQGDETAFSELFKRYWKKMHRIAYLRVRSEETAKEIVQDLFISLWTKRESLSITHLQSYLYMAIKNRVLNYLESQMIKRKHWDYYKQFIPKGENTTEDHVALNELLEAMEHQVDRLPEKSKEIFRLNWQEGQSVTEIARSLNLSEKAIQYHLTKSIKTIRLHLKDFILMICILISH